MNIVAIVVLNFRSNEHVVRIVESFLAQSVSMPACRLVVVDNDGPASDLRNRLMALAESNEYESDLRGAVGARVHSSASFADSVFYLGLDRNWGYAAGNNVGLALAFDVLGAQAALILNPDTHFSMEALLRKLCALEDSDFFGCRLIEDGVEHIGGFVLNSFTNVKRPCREIDWVEPRPLCTPYVSGAALGIPKRTYKSLGGLCESYFLYYEEADYFHTFRKLSGRLPVVNVLDTCVRHDLGASIGTRKRWRHKSPLSIRHANRSCILFYAKWRPALLFIMLPYRVALTILFSFASLSTACLGSGVSGLISGLSHGLGYSGSTERLE